MAIKEGWGFVALNDYSRGNWDGTSVVNEKDFRAGNHLSFQHTKPYYILFPKRSLGWTLVGNTDIDIRIQECSTFASRMTENIFLYGIPQWESCCLWTVHIQRYQHLMNFSLRLVSTTTCFVLCGFYIPKKFDCLVKWASIYLSRKTLDWEVE